LFVLATAGRRPFFVPLDDRLTLGREQERATFFQVKMQEWLQKNAKFMLFYYNYLMGWKPFLVQIVN
jgi:hypothetical protein